MKAKELIKELQKYAPDTEVCIYDVRKSIHNANDEPSSVGIEPNFTVYYEKDTNTPFIGLEFENDDYD